MQRRERLLALQREDETLGKRAVHFTELRAEVERARQAKPVVGAVRTLAISEGALKRAEAALRVARSRVGREPARRRPRRPCARPRPRSREVIGSLAAAIKLETALVGRSAEARRQRAELDRSRTGLAAAGLELAALPGAIAAHDAELREARRLHALLDSRTTEASRAQAVLEAALEHAALHARLPALERATADALEAVRAAELALASLRQARIDDIAGELGLALRRGRALPRVRVARAPRAGATERRCRHSRAGDGRGAAVESLRAVASRRVDELGALRTEVGARAAAAGGLSLETARERARRLPPCSPPRRGPAARRDRRGSPHRAQRGPGRHSRKRHGELETSIARLEQAVADLDERIARERAEVDAARDGPRDRGRAAPGARRHGDPHRRADRRHRPPRGGRGRRGGGRARPRRRPRGCRLRRRGPVARGRPLPRVDQAAREGDRRLRDGLHPGAGRAHRARARRRAARRPLRRHRPDDRAREGREEGDGGRRPTSTAASATRSGARSATSPTSTRPWVATPPSSPPPPTRCASVSSSRATATTSSTSTS